MFRDTGDYVWKVQSWTRGTPELRVATRTALLEECFDAASVCEDGVLVSGQTSSAVQSTLSMVRPAVIAAPVNLHRVCALVR
jgi:hypothetical protein